MLLHCELTHFFFTVNIYMICGWFCNVVRMENDIHYLPNSDESVSSLHSVSICRICHLNLVELKDS